jgi:hypothetical protein
MSGDVLAVEVQGVVIDQHGPDDARLRGEAWPEVPAVADSLDALASLGRGRFADGIWLLSTGAGALAARTREWLVHHRVHDRTGIADGRVWRYAEAAEETPPGGPPPLTHLVAHRLELLGRLHRVPHRYLFQPDPDELARSQPSVLLDVEIVYGWLDLMRLLHH